MAAAAIGLFLVGYFWGNQYQRRDSAVTAIEGILLRRPIELPAFEAHDAAGQTFTAESFTGHWTLLSFADLNQAPGHLAVTRMIEVHNRLATDPPLQEQLQLALLAQRQDLALARDFSRLSPALKVLSGESDELQKLRISLGESSPEETTGAPADEIPLYLIGPSGHLLALFSGTQAPSSVASDLSAISEHSDSLYPANE